MKVFADFGTFHPVPGCGTPGAYWASKDGKRTVMLTRSMWRDGEVYAFVDVVINGVSTRLHGEDVYDDWKQSRPLPGHRNGWY